MIDVLENVKNLLVFDSEDDFYYLQILQRKKENPQIGSNSVVIKNYQIRSVEHIEKIYDEVKTLCNVFNARAMLRLNKRSFRKVAFKALQNISNTMSNDDYKSVRNAYSRACGNGHSDKNKTWLLDIDGEIDESYIETLINKVNSCEPVGDKIVARLPTKNGIHLIVKPFDLRGIQNYTDIDIHKDNPINLYIP